MRLSTAGMHRTSINAILEQQTRMARTQEQVTTGKRFQSASEDPIAATRAAVLDRTVAENEQFGRNSNIVEARLNFEEQSLADVTSVLQYVRERALQGANSTLGADERRMLANDVRQQLQALVEIANRDDGNGEYLFAGTSTGAAPFAPGTTGVNYLGDMTNRVVRIGNSQSIADGHSGADVFMNLAERNGVFRTSVAATNTGTGTIDVGRVVNSTAWVPDNYSLQFTSPTDWQVVDDTLPTPVVIASGAGFTSGQSVSFLGVNVTITGTPAAGDSFSIAPAQRTDMFAMLEELAVTLGSATTTPLDKATFQAQIGGSIANLDQSLQRASNIRAEVGSRLSAIDQAADSRGAESVDLQALLADLRDVDYAEAISRLNQEYTGLQAAQAAYTKIAQLSLFDYL
ncbi:MAG TPA: flagellar hook-associated protein FlgL [Steroidobacteraceae bacterium]|nr:flagellar hook-associated protein FlgL [Steroidobacteraceae bacterium]